ncbi:hypothetical protein C9374_007498 [Naegleria lovaniensis]|uniref:Uncharacterized protein n=1 Tax=Naegleria lovaniensis TaxID=51637 RepID=A0AA88GH84_NAELO|nr:uncharacterized protein C9374_007498 [Naegleria lovaniensis]KAG2379359.1 hypothetical protein C9374_007498 [Naegleria lovaniensis]
MSRLSVRRDHSSSSSQHHRNNEEEELEDQEEPHHDSFVNSQLQHNHHSLMMNENNFDDDDDLESVALSRNDEELEYELPSPTQVLHTPNQRNANETDAISDISGISPFQSPYVTQSSRKSRSEFMYNNVYRTQRTPKISNRQIENRLRRDFPEAARERDRRQKERLEARQFTPACCDAILGLGFLDSSFMMLGDSATSKLRPVDCSKREHDGSQLDFQSPEKKCKSNDDPFEFYSPPPLPPKEPETPQEKLTNQIIARLRKVSNRRDVSEIISKDNIELIALTKATNPNCELFKTVKGQCRDKYIQEIVSVIKEFTLSGTQNTDSNSQQENTAPSNVQPSTVVKMEGHNNHSSSLSVNSTVIKAESSNEDEKQIIETPRKSQSRQPIKLENMDTPKVCKNVKLQKDTILTPQTQQIEKQTKLQCEGSTLHKSPLPTNITNTRVLAPPIVDHVIVIDDDDEEEDDDDCKFLCKK